MIERYLNYIASIRRYSPRTQAIYRAVLGSYASFAEPGCDGDALDWAGELNVQQLRAYEVFLLDEKKASPRTVHLHLSVLSGFCRFLMKEGVLSSNPVKLVTRPKMEKRLPEFYREESMEAYLEETRFLVDDYAAYADEKYYEKRLGRLIINLLYCTGIRRAELIGLDRSSFDQGRGVLRVRGKGDKIREIPLVFSLCQEILLYLQSVDSMGAGERPVPRRSGDDPLLVTAKGERLYPVLVDRVVKQELAGVKGITGRRSPHVLRHTLATELLDDGADLGAIKEMLGHASLAATQVYTHNSIEKLKRVYNHAHPRAKNDGGKHHGD